MSEWRPRTGRLLARQERFDVVDIEYEWNGLRRLLEDVNDRASRRAGRSITTADMATVLLFASHHAERPHNPMALPALVLPEAEALMAESAARLSFEGSPRPDEAPLLEEISDRAFDFRTGLPTFGPSYIPNELGLIVVGSIVEPARR